MQRQKIKCDGHGEGYETFVCQHVFDGTGLGFFSEPATPNNPWPDAWCAACYDYMQRVPDWDKEPNAHERIRLVCHHCYEVIRARQTS